MEETGMRNFMEKKLLLTRKLLLTVMLAFTLTTSTASALDLIDFVKTQFTEMGNSVDVITNVYGSCEVPITDARNKTANLNIKNTPKERPNDREAFSSPALNGTGTSEVL